MLDGLQIAAGRCDGRHSKERQAVSADPHSFFITHTETDKGESPRT